MAFLLSHLLGLAGLVLVLYAGGFLIESVCGALPLPELGGFVRRTAAVGIELRSCCR
jgi:hypothetical protein